MRVAIIDLGTNTFNLLIASVTETGFNILHKEKLAVKLGKSGINSGVITEDAFQRGVEAMIRYKESITLYDVQQTIAIATSAMRDSKNAPTFIKEVYTKTNITIEVISGEHEASLIHQGVTVTLPPNIHDYAIMDIGGGSTEFILVKGSKVIWTKSYDLGVSRLLDWLNPSNPIKNTEIITLTNRLTSELCDLYKMMTANAITKIVGSSGSFDSIHDILQAKLAKGPKSFELDFNELYLPSVHNLHSELIKSTLSDRLNLEGLVQMRADMMVMSSIQINTVLKNTNCTQLYRSSYALKEGLLFSLMPESNLE